MKRAAQLVMVVLGVSACSCVAHQFKDADAVAHQVREHQDEYEQVAETWLRQPEHFMFVYFADGRYRWGDSFVDRTADGAFEVRDGQKITRAVDLASAARVAGASNGQLQNWISEARRLQMYAIVKRGGYVEISLAGSNFSPYGVRYAPQGDAKTYAYLLENVDRGIDETDTRFIHLFGRWFYFEGRG